MKIVCRINNLNNIDDENVLNRLKKYIFMTDGEINIEVGKEYIVYGIEFWDNSPWFYLCSGTYDEYPTPFAAELFEIIDDRLSSSWKLSHSVCDDGEVESCLVIEEWARDSLFYEKLLDGEPQAENTFAVSRQFMDQEFSTINQDRK